MDGVGACSFMDLAKSALQNSLLQNYGRVGVVTKAWDHLQTHLRCCAIEDRGWSEYKDSFWYLDRNHDAFNSVKIIPVYYYT
ncbi:unnamed protein product [Protopolystoma xenopodis]|uniref:Uncharacterized protein n=1 Tax=Protopolystoma xenopodis TaxID=117903 RepID=A0A3S5BTA5_9PLAT|nr:unnamed protein product [Protopolystoma xenopodis]